jgi:predicted DNA-binding transcriptional regulator YafY
MVKSSNKERARRINAAHSLIKTNDTITQAVNVMVAQYGISKRQAYRYIQQAQRIGTHIPIPESKIAFTVKLAPNLIQKLRQYSKKSGHSLSEVVTLALETFLRKGRGRGRKQEHIKTDQA